MLETAMAVAVPAMLLALPSAVFLYSRSQSRRERAWRLLRLLLIRHQNIDGQ